LLVQLHVQIVICCSIKQNMQKFPASLYLIKLLRFFFAFTNEKGNMISLKEHKLNSQYL